MKSRKSISLDSLSVGTVFEFTRKLEYRTHDGITQELNISPFESKDKPLYLVERRKPGPTGEYVNFPLMVVYQLWDEQVTVRGDYKGGLECEYLCVDQRGRLFRFTLYDPPQPDLGLNPNTDFRLLGKADISMPRFRLPKCPKLGNNRLRPKSARGSPSHRKNHTA
jgi:hypothetical protein